MSIPNIGVILSSPKQIGGDAIEWSVAKEYLIKHVADFDSVAFNVPLGPGITLPWPAPAWVQKSATANSRARADMILYSGNTATIVELKDNITPSALGQLLTYWHLFSDDNHQILQVYKVAAGRTVQNGLTAMFGRYGVLVELYPYATPSAAV